VTEQYVSLQLLDELPKPLIRFLWYLWEVYCDPATEESSFLLQVGDSGQRVTILPIDKTVEKDFGIATDVRILIRKDGVKYCMSRL